MLGHQGTRLAYYFVMVKSLRSIAFKVLPSLCFMSILLTAGSSWAQSSCEALFLNPTANVLRYYQSSEAPLLSAEEIVSVYNIRPGKAQEFIRRFRQDVEMNRNWNWVHNPRISPSRASLIVDMYHFTGQALAENERHNLIQGRRSVPGKIEFRHLLFSDVLRPY